MLSCMVPENPAASGRSRGMTDPPAPRFVLTVTVASRGTAVAVGPFGTAALAGRWPLETDQPWWRELLRREAVGWRVALLRAAA